MKTIFKYEFNITDEFFLTLPKDAIVLTVQTQRNVPVLWALVDPEAPTENRYFALRGTGHNADDLEENKDAHYVGTFQMQGGALVFHLFERY
jgi:hypothetical protein